MYFKNCNKNKLKKIVKLPPQPISSVFLNVRKYNLKKYSLDLYICKNCNLIQFSKLPPLKEMYGTTYGYRTSLSPLMVNHMKNKYLMINKKFNLNNRSLILDIGSNDGTFLNFFKKKKIKMYGMDPSAKKFKNLYSKKINIIVDYFSKKKLFEKTTISKSKKFSLITSFAMFYDIENPNSFCKDISFLLDKKKGVWISEFSYFPLLLQNLTYDQICHEHVTYYTLTTFKKIAEKNGLKILDFSFNEINGGSIEVVCAKKNSNFKPNLNKIDDLLKNESCINENSYEIFNQRVENTKNVLKNFLNLAKKAKQKVIGYGASTKGNIVLNHCEINSKNLRYICDTNSYKHGRFTPGSNIKIISKEKMRKINPKYLLILIWSFRSEVIKQEINFIKRGGKLVFHLPMFHIVDKSNYKEYMTKDFKSVSYNI